MTTAELIAKIRAEVERRIKIQDDWAVRKVLPGRDLAFAVKEELNQLLSFLDTLESEKPMQKELEEEIDRIVKCEKEFMNFQCRHQLIGYIARHFAEWGAEHLASVGKTSPEDLEEAAKECNPNLQLQEYFIKGGMWQKEQMMENAVEGEVVKDISNKLAVTAKNINLDGFKFGDKVRIIIIKVD